MMINNLAQIIKSRYNSLELKESVIIVVSSCNCIGRILSGYFSDKIRDHVSGPEILRFLCVLGALAHLCMSNGNELYFWLGIFMESLAYGAVWSVIPVIVGDLYGMKYLGLNYSFLNLAQLLAALILSSYLPATIYDLHAEDGVCLGLQCFSASHYILSFILILAAFACTILNQKTKLLYSYGKSSEAVSKSF